MSYTKYMATIVQKPSPNQDGNRVKIDRIVIHWIAGTLAAADAVFAQPGGTSAHYGIEDDKIHQYIQENRVAYHAGNYTMNQRSVGIEHSAFFDRPASDKTYQNSGRLIAEIAKRHGIPLDRAHIIKHSEVIPTQCPGTVDIDKLIAIAKQGGTPAPAPTPPSDDEAKARLQAKVNTDKFLVYLKQVKRITNDDSRLWLLDPNDPEKYLGLLKAIWSEREEYRKKAESQPDVVKAKEEGRQLGMKLVKDAANAVK